MAIATRIKSYRDVARSPVNKHSTGLPVFELLRKTPKSPTGFLLSWLCIFVCTFSLCRTKRGPCSLGPCPPQPRSRAAALRGPPAALLGCEQPPSLGHRRQTSSVGRERISGARQQRRWSAPAEALDFRQSSDPIQDLLAL